jgi:hypothetical protein
MLLLLLSTLASAVSPDELLGVVERTTALRAQRQGAAPPAIPAATYERVAKGETVSALTQVPGRTTKVAWGAVLVAAPVGRVWSAVNDFSGRTDYSKVSYSQVQAGEHCGSGRQVFQYLPVGFPVSDRWWVSTLTVNRALWSASGGQVRELWFRASTDPAALRTDEARARAGAATPVGASEGAWFLIDVDGRHTLVEYHAYSEPGGSVPVSFANAFATGGVKGTLDAMVKLVAADPRCPQD